MDNLIGHDTVAFNKDGYLIGEIPEECVRDCSHGGSCDGDVEYWVGRLRFDDAVEPVRDLAIQYLRAYGAWDDLDTVDAEVLAQRVLWCACCDQHETGDVWMGLVH